MVIILFSNFIIHNQAPKYYQLYAYIRKHILSRTLRANELLPSTREMSQLVHMSRGTITKAYEQLEDEGFIVSLPKRGYVIKDIPILTDHAYQVNWKDYINTKAHYAKNHDLIKTELPWKKGMISFTSIAPNEDLFDFDSFKKSFLNIYHAEGEKLLNYGYAKGYRPLLHQLKEYIEGLGVSMEGKDLLITNGFTEAFNIVLSTLTRPGDLILCENPTHHTSKKIMDLHDLNMIGIPMTKEGVDINHLEALLTIHQPKFLYLTPSYHNPTGSVLSPDKRRSIVKLCQKSGIPLLEDGFNEELQYNISHCSPLISYSGQGNGVLYLSSFSKILFPGLRIGWIVADATLIDYFESYKRTLNIHTSFIDQALLYQYMVEGHFDRYVKKIRKHYKIQSTYAVEELKKYIPYETLYSDGALHLFVQLPAGVSGKTLLDRCYEKGVVFLLGTLFYLDGGGQDTIRLGISRTSKSDITKGFKIIGKCLEDLLCE